MALTLFHVSDVHFGAEDRTALAAFAARVADERPDAVICTGDITMRGTVREFNAAAAWFAGLAAPVAIEPGNHDVPYYWELPLRLARPFARYDAFHVKTSRPPQVPGLTLVSLPTVAAAQWRLNWSRGIAGAVALGRAMAELDAIPFDTPVLVTCHHPLVEVGTRGRALTRGGTLALTELARRGVLAVLSGHVHDAFDLVRETPAGPVRMIGAGTLSQRLRTTPPSFNELTLLGGRLTCRVRQMQGVGAEALGRYR